MTELLQNLLSDRDEVLLLYGKWLLCSCGQTFDDYSEAENHLVLKHQRRQQQGNSNTSFRRPSEVLNACKENTIRTDSHLYCPHKGEHTKGKSADTADITSLNR